MRAYAMVNLSEDIHPLTEFKRNTTGLVKQMKRTKRPVVLTVNGKAELVVQDANSYQRMLERLDRLEAGEAIKKGLQDVEQGRVRDARSALEELRIKLGL
jgi:prevent-host-death family protein